MRYFLMNKDEEIGSFTMSPDAESHFEQFGNRPLPVGFSYIEKWLENRKASKHNSHLRRIMAECGCDKMEGFIRLTHAASINDTFWVRSEEEDINWLQVSFYRNPFNETISRLAFEGIGLYGIQLSNTSPELSTEGSFRKCWKRDESGGIFLYKRGSEGARNAGLEPYCEVMTAELAQHLLGEDAVRYELEYLHGELATKCRLFTDEQYGYVPVSRFSINHSSAKALMQFYGDLDSENQFRRMLVLDAISFNVDRHAGNHGVLVENDTQKPVRMAPVFDLNLAMLPYIENSDWKDIGTKLLDYEPRIGEDFTRVGQWAMTSDIRSQLIDLKDFQFSFRGDDRFTPDRVRFMESLINRQIEALLSNEILYTRDVFVPAWAYKNKDSEEEQNLHEKEEKLAADIWSECGLSRYFSMYATEYDEGAATMILYRINNPREEVHLNLDTGETSLYVCEEQLNEIDAINQYPELCDAENRVLTALDNRAYFKHNISTK